MGINLGDIISEGDDIFGDGVNIAARLEGIAVPGGICISAAVLDQVKQKLNLQTEDLGERALKNIDTPVRAYRVIQGGAEKVPGEDATAGPQAFVGTPLPARSVIAILPF